MPDHHGQPPGVFYDFTPYSETPSLEASSHTFVLIPSFIQKNSGHESNFDVKLTVLALSS